MTGWAYVDGTITPTDEAVIPIRDRGWLYGDAVFETIRVYGETPFAWQAHLERLGRSAAAIGLSPVPDDAALWHAIESTLDAAGYHDAYVRLSVTRGVQSGRLTPQVPASPTVVILIEPLPRGGVTGESVWHEPASVTVAHTRRVPTAAVPAYAKTHNYLNGIIARLEARQSGTDEALLLDLADRVMEGATSNVFIVDGGVLRTPRVEDRAVLPGITRSTTLSIADELGIAISEEDLSVADLHAAEECFLTNSTWELRPVTAIDGTSFPVGPVTETLAQGYRERVEQTCYRSSAGPSRNG